MKKIFGVDVKARYSVELSNPSKVLGYFQSDAFSDSFWEIKNLQHLVYMIITCFIHTAPEYVYLKKGRVITKDERDPDATLTCVRFLEGFGMFIEQKKPKGNGTEWEHAFEGFGRIAVHQEEDLAVDESSIWRRK